MKDNSTFLCKVWGRVLLAPILFFLLVSSSAVAQKMHPKSIEFPEVGKNFLLCFLYHLDSEDSFDDGIQYVYISSLDDSANVLITCREYPSLARTIQLPPRTDTVVSIFDGDIDLIIRKSEQVSNKVVRVRSSSPIICLGDNGATTVREEFTAVSEDMAGTEFRVMTYKDGFYDHDVPQYPVVPHVCVAAFYESTQVTITPTEITQAGSPKGVPVVFTLDSGQCIYLQSEYATGNLRDLSGTKITSTKPVAVFSGHPFAEAPASDFSSSLGDLTIEAIPPVASLGQGHIFQLSVPRTIKDTGLSEYPGRELVRLLAVKNNTQINFNGTPYPSLLNDGEYIDTLIYAPTLIESTEPILVGDFSYFPYGELDTTPGANFFSLLPPLESRTTDQTFYTRSDTILYFLTPTPFYRAQYVQVVVERSNKANVMLDDELVPSSTFTDVPGNFDGFEFSVGSIKTSPETQHRIKVPGKKENGFVFIVYGAAGFVEGQGLQSAYGYGSQMLYRKPDNLAVHTKQPNNGPIPASLFSASLYHRSEQPVLRINSSLAIQAQIHIYNTLGQSIERSNIYIVSGSQDILLENNTISTGLYFIEITTANGKVALPVVSQ